eukprot:8143237-Pyramimonas_sp.AAC.1
MSCPRARLPELACFIGGVLSMGGAVPFWLKTQCPYSPLIFHRFSGRKKNNRLSPLHPRRYRPPCRA